MWKPGRLLWLVPVILAAALLVALNPPILTSAIEGTTWKLTRIDDVSIDPATVGASITFSNQGIRGYTGCNVFSGLYTLTWSVFSTSGLVATEAGCRDDLWDVERSYLSALHAGGKLTLDGSTLTLRTAEGRVLTFERDNGTP